MTTAGTTLTGRLRRELAPGFAGQLTGPDDPDYDEARCVYNAMIDRRPALIARCTGVDDVVAAVHAARRAEAPIAIRSGGHNAGGLGVCDDGLVVDLAAMNQVEIDPESRRVRVGAGCTLAALEEATYPHGLTIPSGIIGTTGVGGLTLGGGIGHQTRRLGLTIDNLIAAEMVLADGRFTAASAAEQPDLFWAIRGGGGNFGVVTAFIFQASPGGTVIGGPTLWPLDRTAEVMRFYDDYMISAPDEMNGFFAFLTVPPAEPFPTELHLQRMCGVVWCYGGERERADELFRPVRELSPALDGLMEMPMTALQTAFDALYPPGDQWYWKADFVDELSDEAIALHVEHGSQLPTMQSTMHLYPVDGAAARVAPDATAWGYRGARYAQVIVGVDHGPDRVDDLKAWARSYYDALHPHSAGGAYVNFLQGDEGDERVRTSYGENYDRLVAAKRRYDPDNFFRVNQNIVPD